MPRLNSRSIVVTLLALAILSVTTSLPSRAEQQAADKGLCQGQGRRSTRVEDPRTSPANNYGFSEATPLGGWSARVEIDPTQSPDPYVPVVIAGVRSYAGKGRWGKQLMIESVTLKNRTSRVVSGVKLAWIVLTTKSRNARQNQEAALVRGNTALLNQEWKNNRPFKEVDSLFVDFVKEARPLIRAGSLHGDFHLRLRVSEVQFDDGSTWREGDRLASVDDPILLTQQRDPNCQTQEVCFFLENGQGECRIDELSTQFCRRENCSPDDRSACFCNLHNCPECRDADGDGQYDCERDCDDNDPRRFSANLENRPGNCTDGVDNDCDRATDCFDFLCDDHPSCGGGGGGTGGGGIGGINPCLTLGFDGDGSIECECNPSAPQCISPILIDLAGNGFQMCGAGDGVRFDIRAEGVAPRISWTAQSSDDAWLALDRNGNGVIDDGSELFGNVTTQLQPPPGEGPNGFLALAVFDESTDGGNGDGVITAADSVFASLRLWQDRNHNGVSEADELSSLQSADIATLELSYKDGKKKDEYGNYFRYRGKVKDAQGARVNRWAWDVFLVPAASTPE